MNTFALFEVRSPSARRALSPHLRIGAALVLAAGISALSFIGCASRGSTRSGESAEASGTIVQLHLLVTAVALDLDGKPGPDGFGARVYASSRSMAEAIPITRGRLEIVMYDGALNPGEIAATKPLQTWVFEPKKLRELIQRTSIGSGYRFALAWGEKRPTKNRATILARYFSGNGAEVSSVPGVLPTTLH